MRKAVNELDRELSAALARLPDRKEIPDLLNGLSELASASGLRITKFRQLDEVLRDYYAEVPVELKLYEGMIHDFFKIGRFVPAVEDAHRDAANALRRAFGTETESP